MAASTLPIPEPPKTPPPLDDDDAASTYTTPQGLGLHDHPQPTLATQYNYTTRNALDSPEREPTSGRTTDSGSTMLSPAFSTLSGGLSPNSSLATPITPQTANTTDGRFEQSIRNPFNFTTQQYISGKNNGSMGKSVAAAEALGKRRGHKYRHSSVHVSAMDSIFQAPIPRTPLAVPAALPMPTRKEAWRSVTSHQSARLAWCAAHFVIAGYVQFSGAGSLAMTALSRLLLFDAAGATVCVVVDVMGNFEVWTRSSIKHPFGLERADVLAGFAMAVFIAFMGLDVMSHGIEHSLENVGAHEPHTSHAHGRVAAGHVDIASLLAICSTLISALLLKNHQRIGRATNIPLLSTSRWPLLLQNPSHVLTLSCSVLLLILPLLNLQTYTLFDTLFSFAIAGMMIALGVRLGTALASMLLMSYKPPGGDRNAVRDVIAEIAEGQGVEVDEARFWQVHYGLCIAGIKVRWKGPGGYADEVTRLRQKVTSLVRQRLGGKWEVSLQVGVDRD